MVEKNENFSREIQEKYLQVEYLNKELEQISIQLEMMNSKLAESLLVRNSIENIKKTQSFSQLAMDIFVPSEITDDNTFLVNIGWKIFVKMKKEEIKRYLENKIDNFKSVISHISKRKSELQNEIQKQIFELQSLQSNQN